MIIAWPSSEGIKTSENYYGLPHVLLVVDQFARTLGGGERIALKLGSLLPKYGYRASIITFSVHPDSPALRECPCPIYCLPLQRTYDLSAFKAGLEFRSFLRRERIEIVQTFFESSDLWAGLLTKTMPEIKLIWSRRDMGILRDRKHEIAYRLMSSMPDAVFAVSEQVRKHCIEVDRIEPDLVQTIHNGIDLTNWGENSRISSELDSALIITVGNIRRVKGHDTLIKAAAKAVCRFPGVRFHFVGETLDEDYFAELQAMVDELGLADNVQFLGGVRNPRELLLQADIFVLPSRSEGFSNAIVEAMAASLPVIATNVGGNAEAVKEGVTGLIIQPDDPSALSEAIIQLLANPSQTRAMGIAGRSRAEECFTTDAMMNKISTAYAKLLGKN